MLFADRIKELRKKSKCRNDNLPPLWKLIRRLYSKIELGNRRAKREQITIIDQLLQTDENELVTLWVADKFITAIGNEKELATQAFKMAQHTVNQK
jgi:hypothetical protein